MACRLLCGPSLLPWPAGAHSLTFTTVVLKRLPLQVTVNVSIIVAGTCIITPHSQRPWPLTSARVLHTTPQVQTLALSSLTLWWSGSSLPQYPVLGFSEAFLPSPTPISLFSQATGLFWDLVHVWSPEDFQCPQPANSSWSWLYFQCLLQRDGTTIKSWRGGGLTNLGRGSLWDSISGCEDLGGGRWGGHFVHKLTTSAHDPGSEALGSLAWLCLC